MGGGEHNTEPQGRYFYNNPSIIQMFEEECQRIIDYFCDTRGKHYNFPYFYFSMNIYWFLFNNMCFLLQI